MADKQKMKSQIQKIKLTTPSPLTPYLRQTPGSKGIWGNCQFYVNDDSKEFDWWFVINNLYKTQKAFGPKERTVLLTGEGSPDIKEYPQWFINQFGCFL